MKSPKRTIMGRSKIMDENITFEHRLTEVEQRTKSNAHRLDEVEEQPKNLESLVQSVAALATEQKHIQTDVNEIKTDVKSLKERPANRWNGMVDKIIWAVLAAVLAFLLARVGL